MGNLDETFLNLLKIYHTQTKSWIDSPLKNIEKAFYTGVLNIQPFFLYIILDNLFTALTGLSFFNKVQSFSLV